MVNCAFYRIYGLARSIPVVFGIINGKFFSVPASGGAYLIHFAVFILLGLLFRLDFCGRPGNPQNNHIALDLGAYLGWVAYVINYRSQSVTKKDF